MEKLGILNYFPSYDWDREKGQKTYKMEIGYKNNNTERLMFVEKSVREK